MDGTVVKYHFSYREDVFNILHMKRILLSDLEAFEVRDVSNSGLVIGIADDGSETIVAYFVYERQCEEIGHKRSKTHLETLKKAEKAKLTTLKLPIKKSDVFNVYNCYGKGRTLYHMHNDVHLT
jgi:hypothetical protein